MRKDRGNFNLINTIKGIFDEVFQMYFLILVQATLSSVYMRSSLNGSISATN